MLRVFCFLVFVLQPYILPGAAEPENDRVVYIYRTDGCQVETPSGSITLQSADARENTIQEMNSRVGRLLREKNPVKLAEGVESETDFSLDSQYLSSIQFEVTKIPEGVTEEEMIALSSDLPCIEEVARDGIKTADTMPQEHVPSSDESEGRRLGVTPSDPYLSKQWSLLADHNWGIHAQSAWGDSTGHEFVVAVIDSGCDLHHPEVQGKLWVNKGELDCYNGIDDDGNGYIDDCYGWDWVDNDNNPSPRASGHGTGAAGIIASATNNAVGIAGICWFCQIMCLRFISGTEGKISNQVAAIDYAIKNGARISNNSYGGYGYSALEYRAIERAKLYGHLFVTSAGNNNLDTDLKANDHTPSIYNLDNILAVGASTQHGSRAPFSNYGLTSVDVYAPGSSIQTVADGGRYAVVSGTSFAAPMGAGVAALIWSEFPDLSYTQVRESLIATCKLSPRLAGKAVCSGVLDARSAMDYARKLSQSQAPAHPALPDDPVAYISLSPVDLGANPQPGAFDTYEQPAPAYEQPPLSYQPQTPSPYAASPIFYPSPSYIAPYPQSVSAAPYSALGLFGRLFGMSLDEEEASNITTEGEEVLSGVSVVGDGAKDVKSVESDGIGNLFGSGLINAASTEGLAHKLGSFAANPVGLLGSISRVALPGGRYLSPAGGDLTGEMEGSVLPKTTNIAESVAPVASSVLPVDGSMAPPPPAFYPVGGIISQVGSPAGGAMGSMASSVLPRGGSMASMASSVLPGGMVGNVIGGQRTLPQMARGAVGGGPIHLVHNGVTSFGMGGRQSSSQIGTMFNSLVSGMSHAVGGARQRFGQ